MTQPDLGLMSHGNNKENTLTTAPPGPSSVPKGNMTETDGSARRALPIVRKQVIK